MQDTKLTSKINLSEYYNSDDLSQLFKIFPKLNQDPIQNTRRNLPYDKYFIEKSTFYQVILEKIKSYFELKQSFVISNAISIILKELKSVSRQNSTKVIDLPVIPNRPNDKTHYPKRCFSSKSNGKYKINEQAKANTYYTSFGLNKTKNLCDINNVYLNLEKDKNNKPKVKLVHFMNEGNIGINSVTAKQKPNNKKSNLKMKKTQSKRELTKNNSPESNISKIFESPNKSRDSSSSLSKTETSTIRNKSNGIKFRVREEHKTTNNITINNMKNKNDILYDNIKLDLSYNNINNRDFDIFDFSIIVGKEYVLPLIGNYIFNYYNFNEFMKLKNFRNWCQKISNGYINTNYYHNSIHAADITHTCHIYFKEGCINEKIGLDNKSLCALFISCICHDYKHPGFNNNYLIETKHPLALKYNDISVLENMHISETFKLIESEPNCNIFENMENNDYKIFRKQIIFCVLGTDMANHNKNVDFMKKVLKEDYTKTEEDKLNYMNLLVHSADISNPTKKFNTYYKWAKLVVEEFYYQGDKEKELGLKCSCDRNIVSLYKSQLGFIDYIITPFYGSFVQIFPKLNYLKDNIEDNRKKIKEMEEEDNKN